MSPLISVIILSYNHAAYIGEAISSVLRQDYRNLEVIVVDDGSVDDSRQSIEAAVAGDPRVELLFLDRNYGACSAFNFALARASGSHIATCNSDDRWVVDKLSRQLKVFSAAPNLGAVFTDALFIDAAGNRTVGGFEGIFTQPNRSRQRWVRSLIEAGNCLCNPSSLIRKQVFETVGAYNNWFRQLPDLDVWLRALRRYEIFVLPEQLVEFRIHDANTSRPSPSTSARSINEHRALLRRLIMSMGSAEFFSIFGFRHHGEVRDGLELDIEKALYLLDHKGKYRLMFHQLGTELLLAQSTEPGFAKVMSDRYKLDEAWFHELHGERTPWAQIPHVPRVQTPPVRSVYKMRTRELAAEILQRMKRRARRTITRKK